MLALTRSERRAALVVVFLLLLGSAHDLWRAHHPRFIATRAPTPAAQNAAGTETVRPRAPNPAGTAIADRIPGPRADGVVAPIDLNRAGAVELDRLPGVGPVLAARIVEQRKRHGPFHEVDELLAVRGIGPRLLERLRPLVTVH